MYYSSFKQSGQIAENSKTAGRQMTDRAVREQTEGGALRAVLRGEPVNAAKRLVMGLSGEGDAADAARAAGLYDEIAQALVNTRGQDARRALRMIERSRSAGRLNETNARYVANVLTSTGASSAALGGRQQASSGLGR